MVILWYLKKLIFSEIHQKISIYYLYSCDINSIIYSKLMVFLCDLKNFLF